MTSLKALYRNYIEDVWNSRNLQAMEQYFTPDTLDHDAPPGVPPGLEPLRGLFAMLQHAFPDHHITIEQQIEEGDLVVARMMRTGTQKGELFGIPATGRTFTIRSTHILRYRDGKICEHWGNSDDLGMMQQLGVIQLPGR